MRAKASLAVLILLLAACASTPEVRQYQAIATCNLTVQAAARSFGVLYQSKKAEDPALWADRYDKAQASYNAYEKIRDVAVDAAKAGGSEALTLAVVNEAMNQYLQLLAAFGVK